MTKLLVISNHSPEFCPKHNETVKKAVLRLAEKVDELHNKHGIKVVGNWVNTSEHTKYTVYDAPSLEAFQKCGKEPEIAALRAYKTTTIKTLIDFEDALQYL
jgi:hypothetical protein